MESFSFQVYPEVHFGAGIISTLGEKIKERLGCRKVLVVYDPALQHAAPWANLLASLEDAGIDVSLHAFAEPEPTTEGVHKCAEACRQFDFDVIVAVGGGSCIDVVKGARILLDHPGPVSRYAGVVNRVPSPLSAPAVYVPTTAGTGSEINTWAVIADHENNLKYPIESPYITSLMTFYDPEFTLSMPPLASAKSGMDALSHAIESHVSLKASQLTRLFTAKAVSLMGHALPKLVKEGSDLQARNEMMLGSYIAMLAGENVNWGLCHAMASPLAVKFHSTHGTCIGIMLPFSMEYNYTACPQLYDEIAVLLGEDLVQLGPDERPQAAANAVRRITAEIQVPTKLKEIGAVYDALPDVAEICSKTFHMVTNPKPASAKDILILLQAAY